MRIVAQIVQVFHGTDARIPASVGAVGGCEQGRVPVHVKNVEKVDETIVVDPEDAVVERLGALWVEVEGVAHFGRPMHGVQLAEVALFKERLKRDLKRDLKTDLKRDLKIY